MSKPARTKHCTTNWTEYNAALKRRGSLMIWLDADLQWQTSPSGRNGRPVVFSDAAIQFCLTLKCMFGLGLRQATGLAESLLRLARLDLQVPDYSTLCRRQKTLSIAITSRPNRTAASGSINRSERVMYGVIPARCPTPNAAWSRRGKLCA